MPVSNPFAEYYKTISNSELIAILENAGDYQPAALEAAQAELGKRQLSADEIQEVKDSFAAKKERKEKEREKLKAVETQLKTAGKNILESLDPIQQDIPSMEKTFRVIIIIFSAIFLYQVIANFGMHVLFIKDFSQYPFKTTAYLLLLLLSPVAIILFWKRKTTGWILLAAHVTISTVAIVLTYIQYFMESSSWLGKFAPQPSLVSYLLQLLLSAGTLYILCKSTTRKVFSISEEKMLWTIILSSIFGFSLLFIFS